MEKNKENNIRLQEKLQISQEQLTLAEDRIFSLESNLNLYKDKYQAAVNSLELLECQMKALEGDVKTVSVQVRHRPPPFTATKPKGSLWSQAHAGLLSCCFEQTLWFLGEHQTFCQKRPLLEFSNNLLNGSSSVLSKQLKSPP